MAAVTFSRGDFWRGGSERKGKKERKDEMGKRGLGYVEGNSHTGETTNIFVHIFSHINFFHGGYCGRFIVSIYQHLFIARLFLCNVYANSDLQIVIT